MHLLEMEPRMSRVLAKQSIRFASLLPDMPWKRCEQFTELGRVVREFISGPGPILRLDRPCSLQSPDELVWPIYLRLR